MDYAGVYRWVQHGRSGGVFGDFVSSGEGLYEKDLGGRGAQGSGEEAAVAVFTAYSTTAAAAAAAGPGASGPYTRAQGHSRQ